MFKNHRETPLTLFGHRVSLFVHSEAVPDTQRVNLTEHEGLCSREKERLFRHLYDRFLRAGTLLT